MGTAYNPASQGVTYLYVADGFNSFIVKNNGTTDVQLEVREIVFSLARPDVTTLNLEDY